MRAQWPPRLGGAGVDARCLAGGAHAVPANPVKHLRQSGSAARIPWACLPLFPSAKLQVSLYDNGARFVVPWRGKSVALADELRHSACRPIPSWASRERPCQVSYQVVIADNFHYMDENENYTLGVFDTLDLAIVAAKQIVDEYLASAYAPGMSASALYSSYTSFGEDPFIVGPEPKGVLFSAWDYACQRCNELCRASGGA